MPDCLFCKIVSKDIPSEMIYEGSLAVAFKDINPKAKHHYLIVPRKHIDSVITMEEDDQGIMGHLIWDAHKIGKDLGLEGYKLQLNCGKKGGQEIDHVHLHLLAD